MEQKKILVLGRRDLASHFLDWYVENRPEVASDPRVQAVQRAIAESPEDEDTGTPAAKDEDRPAEQRPEKDQQQAERGDDDAQMNGLAIARERESDSENHDDADNADVIAHVPIPCCYFLEVASLRSRLRG